MKHYRKVIALTLLFLIAGAVVNVAMAWGCAAWFGAFGYLGSGESLSPSQWVWPQYLADRGWPSPTGAERFEGTTPGVTVVMTGSFVLKSGEPITPSDLEIYDPTLFGDFFVVNVLRAGWPLRSMQLQYHYASNPAGAPLVKAAAAHAGWRCGFPLPQWIPRDVGRLDRIPLLVLPTGFTANTLLFAGLLYAAMLAPRDLRRWMRRRRGACVRCGYLLQHNATGVCSECGAVVMRTALEGA